ncbi:hypothetical protein [Hymenobacter sp. 5414T-23]|uniref:DUF4961 domain-containing protein n=1 Tax=Hymenobacter sp. 5414T-23 TaxID=2932252 RepID=UPI001FD521CF|nr:hypothetical protein [Hymenobacter sp. 5414T-23]UOQ82396.1 hypothetical protein MUN83_06415 [Hymenobacter sp. 5414T-23]
MPVLHAQIVTTQPTIFKDTDAVTLIYDANQGNKALAGYTGNVYIWTGVITNQSTSNTDWKHVKGTSFSAPIPEEKMTPLGNNKYSITFTPRTYYPGLTSSETILKLAMVFRGDGGKPEGKGDGNSDILVDVAQNTFDLRFTNPAGVGPFLFALNTPTPVSGTTAVAADLALFLNGTKVAEQANATSITANVTLTQAGNNTLRLTATKGATTEATEVVVQSRSAVTLAALPAGAKKDGVTYLNGGTSAIISLTAPNKQFVHVIGEFNNWTANDASYMKRTPNASGMADNSVDGRWWVQIDGLTPGQEYAYQFLIDGGLRVADPFSEKILTPTDDAYINASGYTVYPGLKAYPAAGANGNVSVLQSNAPATRSRLPISSAPSARIW